MKTQLTVAILVLGSCSVLRADLDIREINPGNARGLGWKVKVEDEQDYVRFTVQPPGAVLAQGRIAHLGVWHGRKLITSCILGLHKRKQGSRYQFAVSKQFLTDLVFEVGPVPALLAGESYRIHLRKFTGSKKKKSGSRQKPERGK